MSQVSLPYEWVEGKDYTYDQDTNTVKILKDQVLSEPIVVSGDITLDLGGRTLTATDGQNAIDVRDGTLIVKDPVGNGAILGGNGSEGNKNNEGNYSSDGTNAGDGIYVSEGANVKVEGGLIQGGNGGDGLTAGKGGNGIGGYADSVEISNKVIVNGGNGGSSPVGGGGAGNAAITNNNNGTISNQGQSKDGNEGGFTQIKLPDEWKSGIDYSYDEATNTIKLLQDQKLPTSIVISNDINLDLNGNTLVGATGKDTIIVTGGNCNIVDTSVEKDGKIQGGVGSDHANGAGGNGGNAILVIDGSLTIAEEVTLVGGNGGSGLGAGGRPGQAIVVVGGTVINNATIIDGKVGTAHYSSDEDDDVSVIVPEKEKPEALEDESLQSSKPKKPNILEDTQIGRAHV